VTPSKSRVMVGREGSGCDVILYRPHVSKQHATLELDSCGRLSLVDTSANGSWVNGCRVPPRSSVNLCPGDQVSFLPSSHFLYPDALVYEVVTLADVSARRRSASRSKQLPDAGMLPKSGIMRGTGTTPGEEAPTIIDASANATKRARTSSSASAVPHCAQDVVAVDDLDSPLKPRASSNPRAPSSSSTSTIAAAGRRVGRPAANTASFGSLITAAMDSEVRRWTASLDGGSLVQYADTLAALFDNVSQIQELYGDKLQDFFEDICVQEPNHRLAFASALRQLKRRDRARTVT